MALFDKWYRTKPINEAVKSELLTTAMDKIVLSLGRRVGKKFYPMGEEVNMVGGIKFQSVSYSVGASLRKVLFNWKNAESAEVVSVAIWNNDPKALQKPEVFVDVAGIPMASWIPVVAELISNPNYTEGPTTLNVRVAVGASGIELKESVEEILLEKKVEVDGVVYGTVKDAAIDLVKTKKMQIEKVAELLGMSTPAMYNLKKELDKMKDVEVKEMTVKYAGDAPVVKPVETIAVKKAEEKFNNEVEYADVETVFEDLDMLVKMVIDGHSKSLVICGMPGIGKTQTLDDNLKAKGLGRDVDYFKIKGVSTPMGVYSELFKARDGKLLIFDDCDSVWKNEEATNILKGALDSKDERIISWNSTKLRDVTDVYDEVEMQDIQDAGELPRKFVFTGRVIFISNLNYKRLDSAMLSRSLFIDITLRRLDILNRIKTVLDNSPDGILDTGCPKSMQMEVYDMYKQIFSKDPEGNTLRNNIDFRTFIKACQIRKGGSPIWQRLVQKYA